MRVGGWGCVFRNHGRRFVEARPGFAGARRPAMGVWGVCFETTDGALLRRATASPGRDEPPWGFGGCVSKPRMARGWGRPRLCRGATNRHGGLGGVFRSHGWAVVGAGTGCTVERQTSMVDGG